MQQVIIRNLNRPQVQAVTACYCASFGCQLRGLTFRRFLPPDRGLLLVQRRDSRLEASIHMLGVWIELAVVWINSNYRVVDGCLARPWRPVYVPCQPARYVLELAAGRLDDFVTGDLVRFDDVV